MKALGALVAICLVGWGLWWATVGRSNVLPEVKFVQPRRETLVSNLSTNGKIEPIDWATVRAESPGLVTKVYVKLGDAVAAGGPIAQVSNVGVADQVKAAEARTAQAQAELDGLSNGGRASELADIESNLAKARFERDNASREFGSLKRLNEKQAATMVEVEAARLKVRASEMEIESLERARAALVGKDDLAASRARVQEAQAAQRAAEARLGESAIRSSLRGTVYNLAARVGAYLNPGDLVAYVGRLDRLRVRVYVDEPELGQVAVGQPVKITWDALPGKEWQGTVEKMPSEIVPLGTRQVGEVLCAIENTRGELDPGANVNARIQTNLVDRALTIPKEALHIDGGQASVFVLTGGNALRARPVRHGSDSVTRAGVSGGLREDEWVALPAESPFKEGEKVKPVLENKAEIAIAIPNVPAITPTNGNKAFFDTK